MPSLRSLALLVAGAAVVAVGVPLSGATLSANSSSSGVLGASPDWTAPVVVVNGASGLAQGTTTLSATATDAASTVQSVVFEVRPTGSTGVWTTACTATSAPWSCAWASTTVADGSYDLQATATDSYGNSATSPTVTRTVDNTGPVVSVDEALLPDYLRGTVTVHANAFDAGSGIASVRIQRSLNGGSTWSDLCTDLVAPYSCSWATTTTGDAVLRAIATDVAGSTSTSASVVVTLDNTAPTVAMTYPGSPLAGTVTLSATASDADSGPASVLVEYRASSVSPWTAVCVDTTAPFSCRWDTTAVPDGTTYAFRATATDFAGNSTVSATTATTTVDNRVASVSVEDPGAYLRGTVTLLANANAPGGVASVAIQYAPTGTSTWSTVCTDTTSPYSCDWDTTQVAGGTYDLRAVMTPVAGSPLTSALVTGRVVDNSVLRGLDVQGTSGGAVGRVSVGDTLAYTYSTTVDLTTLLAGWDGTPRTVAARLRDGAAVGGLGGEDVLDVFTSTSLGTAVPLGLLNTKGNYLKGQAMVFSATLTAQTVTVNGVSATRVTLRLDTLSTNDTSRATKSARTMSWTPSAAVRSLTSQPCSTAPVDETGTLDRDF